MGTASSSDACEGHTTFAFVYPDQPSNWSYMGVFGLAAGNAMCQAEGADHVCDYEELLVADAAGEFAGVFMGTTAWVQRTTPATVMGQVSQPGQGGNCVDWTFQGNHLADGEYAEFATAGTITYHLDNDTLFDGVTTTRVQLGMLECGNVMRGIFCCNAACP